jgi:hypothetical protein
MIAACTTWVFATCTCAATESTCFGAPPLPMHAQTCHTNCGVADVRPPTQLSPCRHAEYSGRSCGRRHCAHVVSKNGHGAAHPDGHVRCACRQCGRASIWWPLMYCDLVTAHEWEWHYRNVVHEVQCWKTTEHACVDDLAMVSEPYLRQLR